MKTALITGATSGIGKATARKLAQHFNLILCGRRMDKLEEIQEELSHITDVTTLKFDVREKEEVFEAIENLPEHLKKIDVLVNNAGNAHGMATFQDADIEDLEAMIDGNVKGIIYVTKAVLPLMNASQNAQIVNISSISGKDIYPTGTTYCASKWAVEALSKGMRMDLLSLGIKVINIAPGAVETEFSMVRFKGDTEKSNAIYAGYQPLKAEDIAESIYFAVTQPENVQIADLTVMPKSQAGVSHILRKP